VNDNIEKNIYKKRKQKKLLILHIFDYHSVLDDASPAEFPFRVKLSKHRFKWDIIPCLSQMTEDDLLKLVSGRSSVRLGMARSRKTRDQ
jgi:hypothetical protein